ncbi:19072_t:CDS:2, partial [Dentiscutata erythropus]
MVEATDVNYLRQENTDEINVKTPTTQKKNKPVDPNISKEKDLNSTDEDDKIISNEKKGNHTTTIKPTMMN